MGGFGSTRWSNHIRRVCVEECERQRTTRCDLCKQRAQYLYLPPFSAITPAGYLWACRRCHNLTYYATQNWGSQAGDMIRQPELLNGLMNQALEIYEHNPTSLGEAPPPNIVRSGRRAVSKWFRQRDAHFRQVSGLLNLVDRVPASLSQAALTGALPHRPPKRRINPRSRACSKLFR